MQDEAIIAFFYTVIDIYLSLFFNANNIYGHTISGDETLIAVEKS